MKEKFLMIIFMSILMFGVQQADAQESRLTMDQIVKFLQAFSRTPTTKASVNKTLAKEVIKNGVDFALDKDTQGILRQNGADDILIIAIKKSIADKKSPAPASQISAKKTSALEKPTNVEGYLNRAKMCNKYDYDCQIKNYDKAIEINPQNAVMYKLRGDSYSRKNDYSKAIIDYSKAIERDSKFFDAYQKRLSAYELKGEFKKAISDATKMLEIKPKDAAVYKQRGDFYRYLLDYEEALADFSKAIELKPDNIDYYEDRADTYSQADKWDLAIVDYLKKIEMSKKPLPGDERTYRKLGRCYGKTGQYKKAIESYTKAIEIDPEYEGAYEERAEMYEKIGEMEKAKADRKKYKELIDNFYKRISKEGERLETVKEM